MTNPFIKPPRGALSACLLLALAYFAAAWLSLSMAVPPGYASPIWPAAGVAMAALLLGGGRLWPGVFLGSFAANLLHAWPASGPLAPVLLVSTGIGGGATLQAVLGAALVRRFAPGFRVLEADADIVRFLVLGGPVGCLVSASAGVGTLYLAGVIDAGSVASNWVTWWGGDALGVVIAAPLCMLLLGAQRSGWRLRRLVVVLPVSVVAAMVIAFSLRASQLEVERLSLQFGRHAEGLARAIGERIEEHVNALHAVEALYASSQDVEPEEFERFAMRLLPLHPGMQALAWDERVTRGERERFEREVGASQRPGFRITERGTDGRPVPAGERDQYVVVRYVAPVSGNDAALGYDVYSNPVRAVALDRAADTGAAVATSRISLVQESGEQAGFIVFMPVYAGGARPQSVIERRAGLRGYVAAVYRLDALIGSVRADLPAGDVHLRVEDRAALSGPVVLYDDSEAAAAAVSYPLTWSRDIVVAGREWRLELSAGPAFLDTYAQWQAGAVMLGGLVLTGLLEALLLLFSARAGAVARLVADRTGELTEANRRLEMEILERTRAERSLKQAKEAAEAANIAKSEFLANMSHEIRTPMNAILGLTELSLDHAVDAEQRDNLEAVHTSARSLLEIINEILEFSRIEAGRLTLRIGEFDPRELAHSVSRMLRDSAESKGLELHTRVADDLPARLVGDTAALRRILVNLVGNAIKFTQRGSVEVTLRQHSRDGDSALLDLEVRDTGVGIPRERHQSIFEPFCQGDNSSTRPQSGTGLGLTISARLASAMEGEILLDSCPGDGSSFTCRVPLRVAAEPAPAAPPVVPAITAADPSSPTMRVLLAEDNAVNQKVAVRLLQKLGHEVRVARDGREAVTEARNGGFDLILMDLQMPEMDGLEALRAIRVLEAERGSRTPVVALTAHALDEDRRRCLAAGMDGYIVKPFDFTEFATVVGRFAPRAVA